MNRKVKCFLILTVILSFLLIFVNTKSVLANTDEYYTVNESLTVYNNTKSANDDFYSYVAYNPKSYLIDREDNSFDRINISNGKIFVTRLDSDFVKISEQEINVELPLIGGIYSGEYNNYIAFGQENKDESNTAEVIRIVKYAKDWTRISQCSISAINTTVPFDAGNCRMTETNGKLIVHTAHEMYKSSDGYNHQSNLRIEINQSNMQCLSTKHVVSNVGTGYVSHSFDQYILSEGQNVYTVDLGDGYPRGVVLCKYDVSNFNKPTNTANVFVATGSTGDNYTGLNIGGFELSSNNCLIVGNSVRQISSGKSNTEKRNIYLTVTPKNNISSSSSKTIWLTNNAYNGSVNVTCPHIVKLNNNRFAIMWGLDGSKNYGKVQMVIVDGDGNKLTDVITFGGMVSGTFPIVFNNKILWDVSNSAIGKTIFFEIDASTNDKFNSYANKNLINYDGTEHFDLTENREGDFILGKYDDSSESLVIPYVNYPWVRNAIRTDTFKDCTKLKNVTIPGDYRRSKNYNGPDGIFQNCKSIENVKFLSGTKTIGEKTFYNCTNLKTVDFGDTIQTIGEYAFSYTGITNLKIPDSVTTISKYAFSNISSLAEIKFSNNLQEIGDFAFAYAKALTTITLPDSLKIIGKRAFWYDEDLQGTITIPAKVTSIGESVFEGNRKIQKLVFKNSNTPAGSRMVISDHEMDVGDTYKPVEGAKISKIEKGNEECVEVSSDGTITALKAGNSIAVNYYIKGQDGVVFVTILKINQKDIPLTSISLNRMTLSLAQGETSNLTVTYKPSNTTDSKTVQWTTTDSKVATVTNGIVKAVGPGTATIKAKVGTKTATCVVTVTAPLQSISLNTTKLSLVQGKTSDLTVTYNPSNTTDSKAVTWTTSNSKVATVSGGTVKAVGAGTATITAKVGSKTATCIVTVTAPTPTPTVKPTPTATAKPTPTATAKPTPTATAKPTPTATAKPTPTATAKPTPTATAKPTPTATAKPTPTATAKPTPTATAKPTPTATAKPTPTATAKPTPTAIPKTVGVKYYTHIQDIGWEKQYEKSNGKTSGVEGKGLKVEAIRILLENAPSNAKILYKSHVQDIGWEDWKSNGEQSGTTGQNKKIEAVRIKLENMSGYSVKYRAYVEGKGWQDWVSDGIEAGSTGKNLKLEAIQIMIVKTSEAPKTEPGVQYYGHIQDIGWENRYDKKNGEISGIAGRGLKVEALMLQLIGVPEGASIEYKSHVQDLGWESWKSNGEQSGTTGQNKKIEAVRIRIKNLPGYSVKYRAYVEGKGWQNWVSDGVEAGSTGKNLKLEAIQIMIVKTSEAPKTEPGVQYYSHIQDIGWENRYSKSDGEISGVVGKGLKVEAMRFQLKGTLEGASIQYQAHVQDIGWESWKKDGDQAGTTGQNKKIEAMKIKITNLPGYSVTYRGYVQGKGWTNWVKDGEECGTTGKNLKLEAIQVKIVKK